MQTAILSFKNVDQEKLIRVSKLVNILAILMLAFNLIRFASGILGLLSYFQFQDSLLIGLAEQQIDTIINILYSTLDPLFQGIVWWIMLTAISLGLKMVVQTDINYLTDEVGKNGE